MRPATATWPWSSCCWSSALIPSVTDARFGGTPQDWAEHFDKPEAAALLAAITDRSG